METIQLLAENIFGTNEDRREILRAVVCILARDIRPSDARLRRAKRALQSSYAFLHGIYHTFDHKLDDDAISAYCEVLDAIEIGRATRHEIFDHLIFYIANFGDNNAASIRKTLLRNGIAWDGVDLNRLLYTLQLYPTADNLEKLRKYCKIDDYRVHLSSREFGLVPFLLSATVEYGPMNDGFYGLCVPVLQDLIHPSQSRELLNYIIERIIELKPETKAERQTLNICCSLICSFFTKRRAEYAEAFRSDGGGASAPFYRRVAEIIRDGDFHYNNSPEGWCVYILLFSVLSDVKSQNEMLDIIMSADMIRVYTKTASQLHVVALMSALIMMFSSDTSGVDPSASHERDPASRDPSVHDLASLNYIITPRDAFMEKVMRVVPVKTYKLLVDILENIILSRAGRGYGDRTFTLDLILTCIWRIVIIDEINYSIISARLLNVLYRMIERFCDARENKKSLQPITREHLRTVLHILEYIVPYSLSYDFTDYATVVELKKIKLALVKLGGTNDGSLVASASAAKIAASASATAKVEYFREIEDIEVENITIAYILSVLSFTPNEPGSEQTAVCVPYKVRGIPTPERSAYVSDSNSSNSSGYASNSEKYRKGVKISVAPPVAVPVIVPSIVYN